VALQVTEPGDPATGARPLTIVVVRVGIATRPNNTAHLLVVARLIHYDANDTSARLLPLF